MIWMYPVCALCAFAIAHSDTLHILVLSLHRSGPLHIPFHHHRAWHVCVCVCACVSVCICDLPIGLCNLWMCPPRAGIYVSVDPKVSVCTGSSAPCLCMYSYAPPAHMHLCVCTCLCVCCVCVCVQGDIKGSKLTCWQELLWPGGRATGCSNAGRASQTTSKPSAA